MKLFSSTIALCATLSTVAASMSNLRPAAPPTGAEFGIHPIAEPAGDHGSFSPHHDRRAQIGAQFGVYPVIPESEAEGGYRAHHDRRSTPDLPLPEQTTKPTDPDPRFASIQVNHPHAELMVHHPNTTHLKARNVAGMYECSGQNFKGTCQWTRADGGACHNSNWRQAMGPDQGLDCVMYSARNCESGRSADAPPLDGFKWPGIGNFQTNKWSLDNNFGEGPMSYQCHRA